MPYTVKIEIANNVFQISSDSEWHILWLKDNYSTFVSQASPDLEVFLKLDKKWAERPDSFLPPKAEWRENLLHAKMRSFDIDIDVPGRTAMVRASPQFGIVGLVKFLSSIMLMKKDGFLLHASSVLNGGSSCIFFGPSGSGKTTIARLAGQRAVLSDETAAISRRGNSYYAHATPFAGEFGRVRKNTGGPIKAAFFLNKDTRFFHKRLGRGEAIKKLFCSVMMDLADPGIADSLFSSFDMFVKSVPCYDLYFKPKNTIWRYIDGIAG